MCKDALEHLSDGEVEVNIPLLSSTAFTAKEHFGFSVSLLEKKTKWSRTEKLHTNRKRYIYVYVDTCIYIDGGVCYNVLIMITIIIKVSREIQWVYIYTYIYI